MAEIYHSYHSPEQHGEAVIDSNPPGSARAKIFSKAAKVLATLAILILLVNYLPSVWYSVKSKGAVNISEVLARPVGDLEPLSGVAYQPRLNPALSRESRLKIASIGVDTKINEATLANYEEALKQGVWRVSDFGTPYGRKKPTILAAHKYGYLAWSNLFRRKNSFYSLSKLNEGDIIEITWRQRKYVYKIYQTSEGEEINDYSADIILYTCESLNSPIRIFKYAKLLEI